MKFLRSHVAWKRGAARVNRSQPQAPIDPPAHFPCYGYLVVASYGYEEDAALYLYAEDIAAMQRQIAKEARP